MPEYFGRRVPLKFFVKWRKARIETFTASKEMYGANLMPKSSFYEWYQKFAEECNEPAEACTATSLQKVEQVLKNDRQCLIRHMTEVTGSNREIDISSTDDLGMRIVSPKLVLRLLTSNLKETPTTQFVRTDSTTWQCSIL
ncbi:hypothetical protein QE152_g13226 [Popillia japonica]|uniref:Uncharacterized protein n=1 Tax=Popillia japonica TaxID=7064 RepID=A0AAW1LD15_POPJA